MIEEVFLQRKFHRAFMGLGLGIWRLHYPSRRSCALIWVKTSRLRIDRPRLSQPLSRPCFQAKSTSKPPRARSPVTRPSGHADGRAGKHRADSDTTRRRGPSCPTRCRGPRGTGSAHAGESSDRRTRCRRETARETQSATPGSRSAHRADGEGNVKAATSPGGAAASSGAAPKTHTCPGR